MAGKWVCMASFTCCEGELEDSNSRRKMSRQITRISGVIVFRVVVLGSNPHHEEMILINGSSAP